MSDLSSISPLGAGLNGVGGVGATSPVQRVAPLNGAGAFAEVKRVAEAPPAQAASDRVELSDRARFLDMLRQMPDVRQPLIDRVSAEIATGAYETDERIDAAIEAWAREEL